MKSTVDEIRQRFDADVERFSNLDTGQSPPRNCRLLARSRRRRVLHTCHHRTQEQSCRLRTRSVKSSSSARNAFAGDLSRHAKPDG